MASTRIARRKDEAHCVYVVFTMVYFMALLGPVSSSSGHVGVNYGRVANDLAHPSQVAQFVQSLGIDMVKIYDADPTVIKAFANTQIQLTIGVANEVLDSFASSPAYASNWVKQNVSPFYPATQIVAIAVGNEVLTLANGQASNLVPAMINLHSALVSLKLDQSIKVSSPHSMGILTTSYPPSGGKFNSTYTSSVLSPFFDFLVSTNSFVMVNVYPFFAYIYDPANVPLTYALFTPSQPVTDPVTGLQYNSLFDAQADAFYSAMKSLNASYTDVIISVTETGWPSMGDAGEIGADVQNAQSYNGNLVKNVLAGTGTPLRPGVPMDAFVFALFNENQKPGPTSERNYGLFYPNFTPVYSLTGIGTGNMTAVNTTTPSTGQYVPPPKSQPYSPPYTSSTNAPPYEEPNSAASPHLLQAVMDYYAFPFVMDSFDFNPAKTHCDCYPAKDHYDFDFYSQSKEFSMKHRTGKCSKRRIWRYRRLLRLVVSSLKRGLPILMVYLVLV